MFRSLIAILWVSLSIMWIFFDKGIRDGDEEGHVGTAEMFQQWLYEDQTYHAINQAWRGQTGEYPPAASAAIGAWWWLSGEGQPGDPSVRGALLMSLLVAAWATASLLRRRSEGPDSSRTGEIMAFATVLSLPLANGLSRHFMPEGFLIACVAPAILAAVRAVEQPSPTRFAAVGLSIGLGMLVKQTFVLYVTIPLAWILAPVVRRQPVLSAFAAGLAALICAPWYSTFWDQQVTYGQASAESASQAGMLEQLIFYPAVLWWQGLGPVISALVIAGAVVWIRERNEGVRLEALAARRVVLALVWIIGGLLVLSLVPKKYPRLVAPLTPAVGLLLGAWVMDRARSRWLVLTGSAAMASWLVIASTRLQPAPEIVEVVDPGCIQHWIRPPMDSDLGLHAASVALRARPDGPVWVERAPDIPCELQTTHPWAYHLGPFLRREGLDREVYILQEDQPEPTEPATARLVWDQDPPDVQVDELQTGFQVLGVDEEPTP